MDIGRVYIVRFVLPDNTVVHKVGMCNSSRSTDRMFEIIRSWFNAYRFVPYAELKLDLQCHNPLKVEQYIHKVLAPIAFTPNKKVQGSTEMFTDLDTKKLKWFIQSCVNSRYENFPDPSFEEAGVICKLLMV